MPVANLIINLSVPAAGYVLELNYYEGADLYAVRLIKSTNRRALNQLAWIKTGADY